MKKFRLFIAILLLLSSAHSCKNNSTPAETAAQPEAIVSYPVLTVAIKNITLFTDYPATIQGQQNIEIRPKIDGYVEKIYVDEGATVKKGQKLFHINAPQYEQEVRTAQADIKIAEAAVNAARMQVEKVRPLVEKDIISKYELENAQYSLEGRQAALAQAQARLANAKTNLGYTSITSPVDGVVGTIPYRLGSLVSSNTAQPLTTVSSIGNVFAYFSMNEKEALALSRTTKGSNNVERLASLPPVILILADGSEYTEKGKIEAASGLISTQTGSVSVRATFPNPGNFILSGATGKVRLPQHIDSALLVPQKATYELQGKRFVYQVDQNNNIKSTEIKILEGGNGQFFVVQGGLNPGDRIVLEGIDGLRDGVQILPVSSNADSIYQRR